MDGLFGGVCAMARAFALIFCVISVAAQVDRAVIRVMIDEGQGFETLPVPVDPCATNIKQGYVEVTVDPSELAAIDQAGFTWKINQALTEALTQPRPATEGGGIPGFTCYRTVEEMYATAASLASQEPALVTWTDIGNSWLKQQGLDGYDVQLLTITNQAVAGPKPAITLIGSTHAREYTTAETVTRFAEYLVGAYGDDPDVTWMIDHQIFYLILVLNPDGRKQAETGLSWRKNADNDFCTGSNSRGIDLNRNCGFQWACCGGSSGSACDETFHGPSASSEPETQVFEAHVLASYADRRPPDLTTAAPDDTSGLVIDIHAYGEVILSSWGFTSTPPPNADGILRIGRKMGYFNGYRPQLGSTGSVDGSTKDFVYGELGVPSYTLELGTSFFQDCAFFESSMWPANRETLKQIAKYVRATYQLTRGPDAFDLQVMPMPATPSDAITIQCSLSDQRFDTQNGTEPSQTIGQAELYIDVPPWNGGTPISLTADDGAFDEVEENASATLAPGTLAPGTHSVFVRAQDSASDWGTVSAAWVIVLDPMTAPHISGNVTEVLTGLPIDATVTAGLFATQTQVDGSYDLLVLPGSYSLQVEADGYAPVTVGGINLAPSQTHIENIEMVPICPLYSDDMENATGWSLDAPWQFATDLAHSPIRSLDDSPNGVYANNLNIAATAAVIDVTGLTGLQLEFWQQVDLESGFDYGHVEVSFNGSDWTEVYLANGTSGAWEAVKVGIPDPTSNTLWLRFRLTTDTSVTRQGWRIDDVLVSAASTQCIESLSTLLGFWPDPVDVTDLVEFINP